MSDDRIDGYMNAMLGHGYKNLDPMANFSFINVPCITDDTAMQMYAGNSIVQKIISLPADEAVKNWIKITGDVEEERALQMLDDLNAEEHFANAIRWSRLFGGSAILLLANDGGALEGELNEENITEIEELRVYDKRQIFYNNAVLYDNPAEKNFGKPQYYQVNPINSTPFMVHESRLLLFKGEPLPEYEREKNLGWGMKALDGMWDDLLNNKQSHKLALLIMERLSQGILRLDGLMDKLEHEDGDEIIQRRLQVIDIARSILNTIAIDKQDEYDLKNVSLAQIPELLDRFCLAVSAASNIPFTLLFGRSPAGMNATGQSDLENFYNMVRRIQKRQIKNPLGKLVRLLMLSKKGAFRGIQPNRWDIEFNPLWLPSDKEVAETEKIKAEAKEKIANSRKIYTEINSLDGSEVRAKLEEEGEYKIDNSLDMSGEGNEPNS